jgi:hypothetical protein
MGAPPNLVGLIKGLHVGSSQRSWQVIWGIRIVKQGSIFAPVLFNLFFGAIIKAIRMRFE